jgi:hypothetical protein
VSTRAPWTIGGIGADGVPRAAGPWWAERGLAGASARRWVPDALPGEFEPDETGPIAAAARSASSAAPFAFLAGVVLAILMFAAHFMDSAVLARVLVPIFGFLAAVTAARWLSAKHLDEPWIAKFLVWGMVAKEIGSVLRYRTLVNSYGDVGDASVFNDYGQRYAKFWLGRTDVYSHLDNIRKSNFIRWFTGVVYYLFGRDMIAGFMVFGLIAFVGSYLWYRATVEAVPFLNKKLYFLIVMFAPSILFWPSSIGKEALMQFGIGSAALGTAHLFNGKLLRGLLVALPGAWLLYIVRAHLLALVVLSAAVAYVIGRGPRANRATSATSSLVKPIGLVLVAFLAVFAVGQGAKSLGLPSLTLDSVQSELDQTTASTGQGGSSFDNGGNSLSPLHLPQGMATVLLRPFPWEVDSPLQSLASLEGLALAGFIFIRRKSIAISLRHLRSVPFIFYCWTLTILYSVTFQAFANFGLLDRQRSLVLPALYVLLCLDSRQAREFDDEQRERAALRAAQLARGGL